MVVFSMNSKRVRRPNVRLWEVGDFSAALATSISQRCKETLGLEKWMYDPYFDQESEHLKISGEYLSPYPDVSTGISQDAPCNRENNDQNSLKQVSGLTSPGAITNSKSGLDFGTVLRKPRIMNRRRRSQNGGSGLFGCPWKAEASPSISSKYGKEYGRINRILPSSSDPGFKDSSNDETQSVSKEPNEHRTSDPEFGTEMQPQSNTEFARSTDELDKSAHSNGALVNSVKGWLEEVGFGNFTPLFEIHEVDEETLPLLTLEDLKEMGIVAVGPRRKLFVAIQQLSTCSQPAAKGCPVI